MTERVMWKETRPVIEAAMKVHSILGPGLLEATYLACLEHELRRRGLSARSQVPIPVRYDGMLLDIGYRVDLLVEESIVVEVKSVAKLIPIHEAQLLTYLRLSRYRIGLLINFHTAHLRDGIRRMVNGWESQAIVR
ncbi:MAG: GxxExxY protein [Gemmatimonadaceae bacterium]|nr:GxxExxY protein [Gemmatimonadaceae bacterium]